MFRRDKPPQLSERLGLAKPADGCASLNLAAAAMASSLLPVPGLTSSGEETVPVGEKLPPCLEDVPFFPVGSGV